ncbi:hypothetical protein VP01_2898g1 [Puccinia sorghi]|uniref:No apical meristem-associated C-terminal domain-containing protein n=1 Tax=Puccinia sorghi TaxID=27349 RepID=A0A0L6V1I8_9BASI|nr:hypothetical protein VP01_2898g1 [Puccinia sorghi]
MTHDSVEEKQVDAVSNVTATAAASKNSRPYRKKKKKEQKKDNKRDKKGKEDIITVLRNLANQTALQNQILADQKDVMVTMANKKIMSIDILTISASPCPFYECKQKKILKKIRKKKKKNSR